MQKLSVVLATRNEEANIVRCLQSVENIADEIIIFDEYSEDKTREIAKGFGARVFKVKHQPVFHITKQKAMRMAKGEWILQLDADEVVTSGLSKEIKETIELGDEEILGRKIPEIFMRHQKVIERRDGRIGNEVGEVSAFFIPRVNMFLGKPLIHAGVYPDAVIRLVKKGKAYLPGKSVHEQMKVDGQVSWLINNLEHYDSPTLSRYIERLNRYTDLHAEELRDVRVSRSLFSLLNYSFLKPSIKFLELYFRHRGYLDGMRGFMWSMFSALHYPIAYFKYYSNSK